VRERLLFLDLVEDVAGDLRGHVAARHAGTAAAAAARSPLSSSDGSLYDKEDADLEAGEGKRRRRGSSGGGDISSPSSSSSASPSHPLFRWEEIDDLPALLEYVSEGPAMQRFLHDMGALEHDEKAQALQRRLLKAYREGVLGRFCLDDMPRFLETGHEEDLGESQGSSGGVWAAGAAGQEEGETERERAAVAAAAAAARRGRGAVNLKAEQQSPLEDSATPAAAAADPLAAILRGKGPASVEEMRRRRRDPAAENTPGPSRLSSTRRAAAGGNRPRGSKT
jgi:hypothetical protein